MTQVKSKKAAFESLKEAVELWFESCIERGVLEEALAEVGFQRIRPGEKIPDDASVVKVKRPRRPDMNDFSASESFEVTIPAYIAAKQLEPSAAR